MSTFTRRLLDRDGDYIELYEARISRRFEGSVRTLPEAPEWFNVSEEERGTTPEGSSYLDLSVQIGDAAPQDLFDVTFTFGDGQVQREEGFALDLRPLAELDLPEAAPGSMIYRGEERWAIQSLEQVLPESTGAVSTGGAAISDAWLRAYLPAAQITGAPDSENAYPIEWPDGSAGTYRVERSGDGTPEADVHTHALSGASVRREIKRSGGKALGYDTPQITRN